MNTAERRCVPAMRYKLWGDPVPLRRAFGGIEMALWDARGRAEGAPLSLLLGGAVREQIAVSEYFAYRLPGASEPGEGSPVEVARYCARMIERFDSTTFEGKVATVGLDEEVAMVREVRAAIGERTLRLDANGAWTVPTAREAMRRLEPFAIHYCEDPVGTHEEMAELRAATRASFSTHQIDLPKAARLRAPDAIVTNLNELGGIARTVALIRACEQLDMPSASIPARPASPAPPISTSRRRWSMSGSPARRSCAGTATTSSRAGCSRRAAARSRSRPGRGWASRSTPRALRCCHERFLAQGSFPAKTKTERYGGGFRES